MCTGVEGYGIVVWFGKYMDIASLVLLFGFTTPAYTYLCGFVPCLRQDVEIKALGLGGLFSIHFEQPFAPTVATIAQCLQCQYCKRGVSLDLQTGYGMAWYRRYELEVTISSFWYLGTITIALSTSRAPIAIAIGRIDNE